MLALISMVVARRASCEEKWLAWKGACKVTGGSNIYQRHHVHPGMTRLKEQRDEAMKSPVPRILVFNNIISPGMGSEPLGYWCAPCWIEREGRKRRLRQADRMNVHIVRVSPLGDNFSGFGFDYQIERLEGGASIDPVGMGIVLGGHPARMDGDDFRKSDFPGS